MDYYDYDDYDNDTDYVSPEDDEFYDYMYNENKSDDDKRLFEQCLGLGSGGDGDDICAEPLKEMATKFPHTYNQNVRHMLQHRKPVNLCYLLTLVEHINAEVAAPNMVGALLHAAFRYGNVALFAHAVKLIRSSDEHREALLRYQYEGFLACDISLGRDMSLGIDAGDSVAIQNARIHMFEYLCEGFDRALDADRGEGFDRALDADRVEDALDRQVSYDNFIYAYAATLFTDCCKNGLYIIAEYIFEICERHIPLFTQMELFIWACNHGAIEVIEMYRRRDPYAYDIVEGLSSRFIEDSRVVVGSRIRNNRIAQDIYTRISSASLATLSSASLTKYGLIRSYFNAQWQRERLLWLGLYCSAALPSDIVRVIREFL